jgi:hypothetical protein
MSISDHYCPDCEVAMEETSVTAEGVGDLYVESEREGGLLKSLGVSDHASLAAYCCPECGLVRFYTDSRSISLQDNRTLLTGLIGRRGEQ